MKNMLKHFILLKENKKLNKLNFTINMMIKWIKITKNNNTNNNNNRCNNLVIKITKKTITIKISDHNKI